VKRSKKASASRIRDASDHRVRASEEFMKRNSPATLGGVVLALSLLVTRSAPGQQRDPGRAQLGDDTTVVDAFEDGKGNNILIMGDGPEGWPSKMVFGRNGSYYVVLSSFGGSGVEYAMSFLEPRAKAKSEIRVDKNGGALVCDDKTLALKRVSRKAYARLKGGFASATVKPYPDARRPEYLFRIKGRDDYIYVDASRNNFRFDTMRFFAGKKGKLRQIKIKNVTRHSDGGTTLITLDSSDVLFAPVPVGGQLPKEPYFQTNGKKLPAERLDLKKFDLASIGVNMDEMKLGDVHTPCDSVFGKRVRPKQ
jgi:hypothetical protein